MNESAALPAAPPARPAFGIALAVLAVFLFTLMDTIDKALTARYPVEQVVRA